MDCSNSFGSQTIMVQDLMRSPVSRFFHSSQSPAIVRIGDPSRAVKPGEAYARVSPPALYCCQ
jgi:hypothetical protein